MIFHTFSNHFQIHAVRHGNHCTRDITVGAIILNIFNKRTINLEHIQRKLVQDLVRIRVRPYYLYQCVLVEGAGHFRTPVAKGIEIMEGLRGHTSGYAVPQYIVDAPGGGGKIPVMPNYLLSMSDHKIILRNFEGYVTTYEEPTDYLPSDAAKFKGEKRPEPGQAGVHGLLEGDQMFIKPEGFDETHDRHGIQHRLKDAKKWQPLGIGDGTTNPNESNKQSKETK